MEMGRSAFKEVIPEGTKILDSSAGLKKIKKVFVIFQTK
jgi:hypothetical protein